MKLALKMIEITNIETQLLQCDTTNFSLYGDYNIDGGSSIDITYGHAKDGRDDLKRFGGLETSGHMLFFPLNFCF
jgi:transposase